ncbi:multidrug effflux MFS transporter [Salinicoccus sp. Marseille-QA3877]
MNSSISNKSHNKYWIVILLGALTAIGPLSMDMYLPALPVVADDLNTSASLVQMSLTTCLIGLATGQLMFGPLSDIRGRKKPLIFSLAIYSVTSLALAFTTTIGIFILLRFIQGFTGAAGIVIARAAARDIYSGNELTKAFALLALVSGAAPILAPISGGFVLNFGSWPVVFYIIAMIGILLLLSVMFLYSETLPAEGRSEGTVFAVVKTFGDLLKDKVFLGISFTQSLIMSGMFAYIAGSPFILQNIYEVSPQQFSLIFALNGLGIIIAAQISGRIAAKVDEVKIMLSGVLLSLTGSVLLIIVVVGDLSLPVIIIALFMVVSSIGFVSPTAFSLGLKNQKKSAGSASAFLGLLPFIGGAVVSPLVGLGGEHIAWPLALVTIICSISAFAIFMAFVWRKEVQSN